MNPKMRNSRRSPQRAAAARTVVVALVAVAAALAGVWLIAVPLTIAAVLRTLDIWRGTRS